MENQFFFCKIDVEIEQTYMQVPDRKKTKPVEPLVKPMFAFVEFFERP